MKPIMPILDNHMHIDPRGRGLNAIKDFKNAGGTHIILVSKPSWTLSAKTIENSNEYVAVYEETIDIAKKAREIGVTAFPVLGVHPAEITKLTESFKPKEAVEIMKSGIDIAANYVKEQYAIGIKSGRPHYPVSTEILDLSNEVMEYAFEICAEINCAVQLHTEDTDEQTIIDISKRARKKGMPLEKVVKHFSPPLISEFTNAGIFPSVLSSKKAIDTALECGTRFMMETDYIDDNNRPGAVLGPKTVPKRTFSLLDIYEEEVFWKIHKDNPEKVYDIKIEV